MEAGTGGTPLPLCGLPRGARAELSGHADGSQAARRRFHYGTRLTERRATPSGLHEGFGETRLPGGVRG